MTDFVQLATGVANTPPNGDNAWPDYANAKVYSWRYPSGVPYLLTNSSVDGSAITNVIYSSVLVVSGHNGVSDHSGTVLAGKMYVNTSTDYGTSTLTLSKIDIATNLETDAIVPTLYAATGNYGQTDQFSLVSFAISGTHYVAIAQEFANTGNANFEIVNGDTMVSQGTGEYPHSDVGGIYMVAGPTTLTACTIYLFCHENFGDTPSLVKAVYNTGTGISFTTIKTYAPSDFDPTWTGFDAASSMSFDASDGNLVIQVQGVNTDYGSANFQVVKLDTTTGDVLWGVRVAGKFDNYGSPNTAISDLSAGTYLFWDELARLIEIDTADGSIIATTYTQHFLGQNTGIWDSVNRVVLFYDQGAWLDDAGWSIYRPDEAGASRWALVDGVGQGGTIVQAAPYRDPSDWGHVWHFRCTHNDLGELPDSGFVLIQRDTKTGATVQQSSVWEFNDAANAINSIVPSAQMVQNLVGAPGGSKLYVQLADSNASPLYTVAIFEIDRTTLAVTQSKLTQNNSNWLGAGKSGSEIIGSGVRVISGDGQYLCAVGNVRYDSGGPATNLEWWVEVWCPTHPSLYSFIKLADIGIPATNGLYNSAAFDGDGFLWLPTSSFAANTLNPKIGQSTLWKISLDNGSGTTNPALTVVTSYTIPDDFHPFTGSFASTLVCVAVTYNQTLNQLVLWYNYTYSGTGYITCLTFDIDTATFSSPLEIAEQDTAFYSNADKLHWNNVGIHTDYTGSGNFTDAVLRLIDTTVSPPTKTDTTVSSEWAIPFNLVGSQSALAIGMFYTAGSDYIYVTGMQTIFYDEYFGYMDALLLPGGEVVAGSLTETASAADTVHGGLAYQKSLSEEASAVDTVNAAVPKPVWMAIGNRRETLFPN